MSLFSKETCVFCNSEVGALTRCKLNDGTYLCNNCVAKTHLTDGWNINTLKSSSLTKIKERMEFAEKDLKENTERRINFTATRKQGGYIWFDDEHKWFVIPTGTFSPKIDNSYVFKYDEILDYEVLEDGTSITKGGFGKAIIGGAIFGLAGAIAGGTSKKTKQVCTKLQIKITTRNIDRPVNYITLINTEFKKEGFIYKTVSKNVQDILSKIQIIIDQIETEKNVSKEISSSSAVSVADEIKKYKELLDVDAITQEEFDKKKKELLGF